MGLFDKALGKESGPVQLDKAESFAAVAIAAVYADGEINQEELERIAMNLAALKPFRRHNLRDIGNTVGKVAGHIKKRGTGPVLAAAKTGLNKDELNSAFFLAADLVLADGVVEQQEKEFLEELQTTLGLDSDTALKIVEVAAIKNRG